MLHRSGAPLRTGDLIVTLPSAMAVILPVITSPLARVILSCAQAKAENATNAATMRRCFMDGCE